MNNCQIDNEWVIGWLINWMTDRLTNKLAWYFTLFLIYSKQCLAICDNTKQSKYTNKKTLSVPLKLGKTIYHFIIFNSSDSDWTQFEFLVLRARHFGPRLIHSTPVLNKSDSLLWFLMFVFLTCVFWVFLFQTTLPSAISFGFVRLLFVPDLVIRNYEISLLRSGRNNRLLPSSDFQHSWPLSLLMLLLV